MDGQKIILSLGLFIMRLAIGVFVIAGFYYVGVHAYNYGYSVVSDVAMERAPGREVSISLAGSMTEEDTAKYLERTGLVKDAEIFRLQLKLNKYDNKLKPGEYVLNTSMTPKEIMAVLAGEAGDEDEEEEK